MKPINLIFKDKPNNKNPINLIFGDIDDGQHEAQTHIINAELSFYDFGVNGLVNVNYELNDDLVYSLDRLLFNTAQKENIARNTPFNNPLKLSNNMSLYYAKAEVMTRAFLVNWGAFYKFLRAAANIWSAAEYQRSYSNQIYWYMVEKENDTASNSWCATLMTEKAEANIFWYKTGAVDSSRALAWSVADYENLNSETRWGKPQLIEQIPRVLWGIASMPGGCGESARPPFIPPYVPPIGPIAIIKNLVFCKEPNNKNPINLVFGDECIGDGDGHTIDDKKVYILKNKVEILRTDNGLEIKAFSVNIGASRQNYLWSGSLSLPFSEFEKIKDKPEIEININQYKFTVDIDEVNIKKAFNSNIIELNVLSTTNQLKDIKSHKIDEDMNASTIMLYQLERDDLKTGFSLKNDNGLDWVIQNGLIEYDDASTLDVITKIALATGDTVISHVYKKEIIIKPKYPMSEPVYSLPSGKLFDYSVTEEKSTMFNAIVISGENVGVTAIVRKEGTAGERIAPMQVNRLITAEVAARRSAINAIYNTNDTSSKIDVVAPLFEEAPLLYPSDLVKIDNDIGWIDDVSISAEKAGDAFVVRHSFSIEKKVA